MMGCALSRLAEGSSAIPSRGHPRPSRERRRVSVLLLLTAPIRDSSTASSGSQRSAGSK
jgi:hypothetical protein